MGSIRTKKHSQKAEPERLFKYWIEVRNLQGNTLRKLPLTGAIKVPLVDPPLPSRRVLRIQDDSEILEADDFEKLRVQLRQRYPDDTFERTLHWERDLEAEERRERALQSLVRLIGGCPERIPKRWDA